MTRHLEKIFRYIGSFKYLNSKLLFLLLVASMYGINYLHDQYLLPISDNFQSEKAKLFAKQNQEKSKIKPSRVIECLNAFGKIYNLDIWINSIEYKDGCINIITHSINLQSVDDYINEFTYMTGGFIVNKDVKDREVTETLKLKATQEKEETVPYALALLKKRQNKTSESSRGKNENNAQSDQYNKNEPVPDFSYEANIKIQI